MGPARRNSRVVIVGDGPERLNLEKTIGALGLGSAVILTGYRVDVYRFYGLFDVFVLNSFAEGMSNTLLEAMACGLPVVSTSVGASSSVVSDGERGRLTAVGNDAELAGRIQSYKERPDLRAVHGAAARQFVEQEHSLSSMVGSYARLYSMVPLRRRV
jgi:glycosyltransferase involved in cell wall biosynthesis